MKLIPTTVMLLLCAAAPSAFAGTLSAPPLNNHASDDSGNWMDQVSGKKFFAVDGSTVSLSQNDGGYALDTVMADGTAHETAFNMLSDTLGSITEGEDKHVTGVFHVSGSALEANFSDGRVETIAVNAAGGLTVLLNAPDQKAWCMKWYPQGHGFDDADKKEALAEYATKLGLAQPTQVKDHPVTHASCLDTNVPAHAQQTAATQPAKHSPAEPISVRASQVHLIDPPVATTPAQAITAPLPAAPVKTADLAADHPLLQSHGASSCLKIDNDGSSWGFRNGCGYDVQYAWCLQKGEDHATSCGTGTGRGSLAGNAFAALLPGDAAVDADNQFRWVACHGGSDVSAQLDRSDPPAGRCVVAGDQ